MIWFSIIYFFFIGIVLVAFSFKRLRFIYRFVKMVLKIPGPSWWELATMHAKYLLGNDTITHMSKICEEYGYKPWGIFTTTLDYLVIVSDPDSVGEVFKNPHTVDKSAFFYAALTDYMPKGSLVINGERWKWHRKTINPAFRKRNLDLRIPVIKEGAEEIVKALRSKADGPSFDMTDIIDIGTVDVSLRFITTGVQIVPSAQRFCKAVEEGSTLVKCRTINPFLHRYNLMFNKETRKKDRMTRDIIKESECIFKEAKVIAKNRMSNRMDPQPVDVLECLSHVTLVPGLKVDEQEILDEIMIVAVGASETTRTVIKIAMMLLALHPDKQKQAFQEVQSILEVDNRLPCPQDLQGMKYLDAVIKETMRLYPTIPLIGRQVSRSTSIGGVVIPGGASVLINLNALHRNPDLYDDPGLFLPERFLKEEHRPHPYAFLPFGSGPRICVGNAQAMMVTKIVMASIVRNFTIIPGENVKSMADFKIKLSVSISICEPMIKLISRKSEIRT